MSLARTRAGIRACRRTQHHAVDKCNAITVNTIDSDPSSGASTAASVAFAYDLAGNLTSVGPLADSGVFASGYSYTYNAWSQLESVTRADGQAMAAYKYDALGRRIWARDLFNYDAANNYTPVDHYYYDGHRVIELRREVMQGTEPPGDYSLDTCPPIPAELPLPGEAPTQLKRIAGADGAAPAAGYSTAGGATLAKSDPGSTKSNGAAAKSNFQTTKSSNQLTMQEVPISEEGTPPPPPPPAPTNHKLVRNFIYGMDYIDEHVAQITPATTDASGATVAPQVRYVLQDANYNVVGIARDRDAELIRQYRYSPYGQIEAVEGFEDVSGTQTWSTDVTPETWHLFQGLWYTDSTGLYYARARDTNPLLGRPLQPDPNQQALVVTSALAMNGQVQNALAGFNTFAQYGDGSNLYGLLGNNPNTGTDPSGLFTFLDISGASGLRSDLMATQFDVSGSLVDSLKGIAFLQFERNQALDAVLGTTSNPFDFSGIDRALGIYRDYQTAMMATFGLVLGGKLISAGKGIFNKLRRRAGGRQQLLDQLSAGTNSRRGLFGFGGARRIPRGFRSAAQFDDAAAQFRRASGDPSSLVGIRGSAATGVRASTGELVANPGDFDFFIVSDRLYEEGLRNGARGANGALRVSATKRLFPGLHRVERSLKSSLGKKSSIRIFNNAGYAKVRNPNDIMGF